MRPNSMQTPNPPLRNFVWLRPSIA